MGYSIFKVAHQGDSVGNRLKEVQDGVNDLARFGKMVELASFLPFEYVFDDTFNFFFLQAEMPICSQTLETTSRLLAKSTMFRKVSPLTLLSTFSN